MIDSAQELKFIIFKKAVLVYGCFSIKKNVWKK